MIDGTWQLVHVDAWHPGTGGQWRCLLRWGNWGAIREGWYTYNPAVPAVVSRARRRHTQDMAAGANPAWVPSKPQGAAAVPASDVALALACSANPPAPGATTASPH